MSNLAKPQPIVQAARLKSFSEKRNERTNDLSCWVAREIYGDKDRSWLAFREWLYFEAPWWFRKLYVLFGRQLARLVRRRPHLKAKLKRWMNARVDQNLDLNAPKFLQLEALYLRKKQQRNQRRVRSRAEL